MSNRRSFLQSALATGAGALVFGDAKLEATKLEATTRRPSGARPPSRDSVPVTPLDLKKLPWTLDNGTKVFHLVSEPVKQELVPGKTLEVWGFNGSAPGPLIEANQGDRVRIVLDNHLPEPITLHWHGLEVPNGMDGVAIMTQHPILPGRRFVYEFTLRQEGTYFYHSHMAMQEMFGLIGPLVLHPAQPYSTHSDRDFVYVLQEYATLPNNPVPNSMSMEFNWLTMNGKSGPATTPIVVRQNEHVKIRFINMGMDHHPMHLHGHQFWITGTEGGRQPQSNWIRRNTVLVGVAQAYDVEFDAVHVGDWMLHCHLPHHMMNQMSSSVGPMTRTHGLPAGLSMESGMGMPSRGTALSKGYGPSMGRAIGIQSNERPVGNGPRGGEQEQQAHGMEGTHMPGMNMPQTPGENAMAERIVPHANQVPGFPQDAYMEGPDMAMDAAVAKPETYGLPAGWSGHLQGMMTLVRVMTPTQYDKIEQLRAAAGSGQ